jgi:muramoyltetrapeptide carboxypeptidase
LSTIIPPFLQKGDTIALVTPARLVTREQMKPAIEYVESKGFKVLQDPDLYRVHHQFGGTEEQRAELFNRMLADTSVKALWSARGAYGTARMVDLVDFSLLEKQPKWVSGFSDESILLNQIHRRHHMASLHSTMPVFMHGKQGAELEEVKSAIDSYLLALEGKFMDFDLTANSTFNKRDFEGEIIGGNLSVMCSMAGSVSEPEYDGNILFLEDLDEYYYHIDRMILMLKRAGKLKNLKALLVGSFIKMHDHEIPFGYNVKEIILQHCQYYGYPIIFDVNAGHHLQNLTIPFGVPAKYKNGFLTFANP